MLSTKAGMKIYSRFEELCNGNIVPKIVNELTINQIRNTGTSSNKTTYIKALTDSVLVDNINFSELSTMSDSDVINKLNSIKGIVKWTAKMHLIFVLDRQDILPTEDATFL